jgi:hypothetical protein
VVSEDSLWTLRSARWLMAILVVAAVIGVVTYYYALQVDTGESDDTGKVSASRSSLTFHAGRS